MDEPTGLDAADQSAADRIADATGDDTYEDTGPGTDNLADPTGDHEGIEPDEPSDEADDEEIDFDNMTYRDAKKLRKELQKSRERWKPLERAFDGLDDEVRSQIVEELGPDVGVIGSIFASMHPDDRAVILDTVALMQAQPDLAADRFKAFAEALASQGDTAGADAMERMSEAADDQARRQETGDGDSRQEVDELDRPVTRRELMEWEQRQQAEAAEAEAIDEIMAEARDLGYDPESDDPIGRARFATLISLAQELDGDLRKAHDLLEQERQQVIEEYTKGKRADARRPVGATSGAGRAPSGAKEPETMEDAERAMRARLDAAFGPSRRRR